MARKSGLGRGLDALIPGGQAAQPETGALHIHVDDIEANPQQPRSQLAEADLQELAASIREHGVLQPVIVSPGDQPGKYTLIAGERRLRASRLAGLSYVPAVIRSVSHQEQLELALIENVQRADLTPLETAEAYSHLLEDFHLSQEEIAVRVGKSRVSVTNTLRLLKLSAETRDALLQAHITEGHARALLALSSQAAQNAALQTVLRQDLTVRQTEELVRRLSGQKTTAVKPKTVSPEIQAIEDRLRKQLGTKVHLTRSRKGGTLVIHYFSDEELEALIGQILKDG